MMLNSDELSISSLEICYEEGTFIENEKLISYMAVGTLTRGGQVP
jgi:hypothetical protein